MASDAFHLEYRHHLVAFKSTYYEIKSCLPLTTSTLIHAGTVTDEKTADWVTPTLNIRARFEARDFDTQAGVDPDPSTAFTSPSLGLKTKDWNSFSAVVEGEFTQVIIGDYTAG